MYSEKNCCIKNPLCRQDTTTKWMKKTERNFDFISYLKSAYDAADRLFNVMAFLNFNRE